MIKYFYQLAVSVIFLVGLSPGLSNAQLAEKWWLQSSLADTVTRLQFHTGASYSFTRMKGIISGSMNTGNLAFVLRKGVFTNFSRCGIDKLNLNLRSSVTLNYATKSQYFTDYFNVDLSKATFLEGGFIWERDDALLLQNRYTFYGGTGFNISFAKRAKLKSLFATGRIDQEYFIPVDNLDVIKKPFAAFYSVHDLAYEITPETSVAGKIYCFSNLSDFGRFRYGWLLNLSVSLWKHVSLVAGFHFRYDRELKLLGLIPDNSTQNFGIEVSF